MVNSGQEEQIVCLSCNQTPESYISFDCGHDFCLNCLALFVIEMVQKDQISKDDKGQVKFPCSICNQISTLDHQCMIVIEKRCQDIIDYQEAQVDQQMHQQSSDTESMHYHQPSDETEKSINISVKQIDEEKYKNISRNNQNQNNNIKKNDNNFIRPKQRKTQQYQIIDQQNIMNPYQTQEYKANQDSIIIQKQTEKSSDSSKINHLINKMSKYHQNQSQEQQNDFLKQSKNLNQDGQSRMRQDQEIFSFHQKKDDINKQINLTQSKIILNNDQQQIKKNQSSNRQNQKQNQNINPYLYQSGSQNFTNQAKIDKQHFNKEQKNKPSIQLQKQSEDSLQNNSNDAVNLNFQRQNNKPIYSQKIENDLKNSKKQSQNFQNLIQNKNNSPKNIQKLFYKKIRMQNFYQLKSKLVTKNLQMINEQIIKQKFKIQKDFKSFKDKINQNFQEIVYNLKQKQNKILFEFEKEYNSIIQKNNRIEKNIQKYQGIQSYIQNQIDDQEIDNFVKNNQTIITEILYEDDYFLNHDYDCQEIKQAQENILESIEIKKNEILNFNFKQLSQKTRSKKSISEHTSLKQEFDLGNSKVQYQYYQPQEIQNIIPTRSLRSFHSPQLKSKMNKNSNKHYDVIHKLNQKYLDNLTSYKANKSFLHNSNEYYKNFQEKLQNTTSLDKGPGTVKNLGLLVDALNPKYKLFNIQKNFQNPNNLFKNYQIYQSNLMQNLSRDKPSFQYPIPTYISDKDTQLDRQNVFGKKKVINFEDIKNSNFGFHRKN